jgi:translation initiation factor IF-2
LGKIRVNKLALELNIQNEDILNALNDKGHAVKNYMSSIDNTIADEIRQFFTQEPEPAPKTPQKPLRK